MTERHDPGLLMTITQRNVILFMKMELKESNFILFKGFVKLRPDKLVNEIIVRDLIFLSL